MTISAEEIGSPEAKAEIQMHVLDGMADAWIAEVDLTSMIKNATSPMDLNKNATANVKEKFRLRMEAQIDAIARQAFIEGAHRAVCMVQDAYNPIVTEQRARIAALEAQLAEAVAALEPFARVGRIIDGPFGPALFAKDDQAFKNGCAWRENGEDKFLTWGDFRRAAAIRARSEQEGK